MLKGGDWSHIGNLTIFLFRKFRQFFFGQTDIVVHREVTLPIKNIKNKVTIGGHISYVLNGPAIKKITLFWRLPFCLISCKYICMYHD